MPRHTKPDELRRVILILCDAPHRQRVSDLLDALEQDIGYATLGYATQIARVAAADAGRAWGGPGADRHNYIAASSAHQVMRSIYLSDWDRADVLATLPEYQRETR